MQARNGISKQNFFNFFQREEFTKDASLLELLNRGPRGCAVPGVGLHRCPTPAVLLSQLSGIYIMYMLYVHVCLMPYQNTYAAFICFLSPPGCPPGDPARCRTTWDRRRRRSAHAAIAARRGAPSKTSGQPRSPPPGRNPWGGTNTKHTTREIHFFIIIYLSLSIYVF